MTTMLRNKYLQTFLGMSLFLVTGLPAMASETAGKDEWQFDGNVYLWGAEIQADLPGGGDIDISFSDIVDNLDMAFMGGLGARKDKLRLFTDIIYMKLEDDDIDAPYVPSAIDIGVTLEAWIVQPTAAYTVYQKPEYNIELLGGVRYLWLDVDLDISLAGGPSGSGSDDGSNWDGIVGVQGNMSLTDKWGAVAYLDYGTGDSDYTYQALAGLNYQYDSVTGTFGYRHLRWEFEDDTPLENLRVSGPYAGVKFNF